MQKGTARFSGCFTLALVLNLTCSSQQIPAKQSPTAEQVLITFVQAIGGMSTYDSIKTSVSKGSIIDWDGKRIAVEKYSKCPDKSLVVEHRPQMEIRRGHDGKVRWVQEGNHKPKRVKLSYDFENEVSFADIVHWSYKLKKANFRGEADVLDRKAYVLAVVGPRPTTLYFDQQTGLLVRKDTSRERRQVRTYYLNYVETAGAKLPWNIVNVYMDTGRKYISDITEARTNVPLDDAIFAVPTP